jgi:hypothetical protein
MMGPAALLRALAGGWLIQHDPDSSGQVAFADDRAGKVVLG